MSEELWKSTISEKVVKRRQEMGLTQAQLAVLCGLSQASICNLELGRHAASAGTLRKVALGLGVSTDWLLGMEPEETIK